MTPSTLAASLPRPTDRPNADRAGRLARWAAMIDLWVRRRRTRARMLALDDRMLDDLGLGRADVERETAKMFWEE